MNLQSYIDTTRRHNEDVSELLEKAYQALYGRLTSGSRVDVSKPVPELVVVNTLNKKSELLAIGNRSYLLYDQYLGQTMNEMTRLFFTATSPDDAKPIAYRLMSEEASCYGRLELATFLAYLYSVTYNESHAYKDQETREQRTMRAAAVEVQEAYIIAHENAHYLWPRFRSDPLAIDTLLDSLLDDEELAPDDLEEVVQAYLDDLSFQYQGTDVPHAETLETAQHSQPEKP